MSSIFKLLQKWRYRYYLKLLDLGSSTLLDIGCEKGGFIELAKSEGYVSKGIDIEDNVETTTKKADIITCFEVLEHTLNPVKAILNLKKNFKKQLIISIPNEPLFSLFRLSWEKEHLWAITPKVLKHYLGNPTFESKIIFKRYYVGIWEKR